MINTGRNEGFHLKEINLERLINKKNVKLKSKKTYTYMDILGKENNVFSWSIDELSISNTIFKNINIVNLQPWGLSIGGPPPESEVIGLGIFHDKKFMLDFKNNKVEILENIPDEVYNWPSYPIEKTNSGIKITVYINKKPLDFIIDTAASNSIVFSNRLPKNSPYLGCRMISLESLNSDCNVKRITLKDLSENIQHDYAIVANNSLSEKIDFDGLLGMSFMRNKIILIDLINSKIYIQS